MSRRRRASSVGSALAVAVLPLALTTSVPTAPAAHMGHGVRSADAVQALLADVPEPEAPRSADEWGPASAPGKGEVQLSSPKGTRVWTVSALAGHDLPVAAMKAYHRAAALMARTDPGCRIPWTLLAGIGRVESDHGRYGGSRLGSDGVSHPKIIGVRLDGSGPVAAIRDTDNGKLDGDKVWDRAVGPMQFLPSTWEAAARDGDGDGRVSPYDLDDAAATAAAYLCAGSGDLSDRAAQAAAIYRYNQDDYYVALVQAFEVGYRTGVFDIPAPPVQEKPAPKHHRKRHHHQADTQHRNAVRARPGTRTAKRRAPQVTTTTAPKPQPPTTTTTQPKPAPKPSPIPTPAPPQPTTVTAVLTESNGTWFLGGKPLDLGVVGQLQAQAPGDFDKDGSTETNGEELAGMVDQQVTMVVISLASGKLGIYSINGVSLG